jgi:hypothetical protein
MKTHIVLVSRERIGLHGPAALHESAFGPKRTSIAAPHMSAFGDKADGSHRKSEICDDDHMPFGRSALVFETEKGGLPCAIHSL